MEFLNYMLDKMGTIKNALKLLILILMGFCYILYSVRKHSARKNFVHQRADSGQKEKDDGEKAAKKIAAIVAVGLIGVLLRTIFLIMLGKLKMLRGRQI